MCKQSIKLSYMRHQMLRVIFNEMGDNLLFNCGFSDASTSQEFILRWKYLLLRALCESPTLFYPLN